MGRFRWAPPGIPAADLSADDVGCRVEGWATGNGRPIDGVLHIVMHDERGTVLFLLDDVWPYMVSATDEITVYKRER